MAGSNKEGFGKSSVFSCPSLLKLGDSQTLWKVSSLLSEGARGRLTLYDCWCTEQETKPEWLVTCLTPPRWRSHRGTCTLPEQHHCSPGRSSMVLWLLHQTTAKRPSASPVPILRPARWLQLLGGTSITLESRTKRNTTCSHHKSRKWQEKCCDQGCTRTATAFSLSSMASTKANQKTGHLPMHVLYSL